MLALWKHLFQNLYRKSYKNFWLTRQRVSKRIFKIVNVFTEASKHFVQYMIFLATETPKFWKLSVHVQTVIFYFTDLQKILFSSWLSTFKGKCSKLPYSGHSVITVITALGHIRTRLLIFSLLYELLCKYVCICLCLVKVWMHLGESLIGLGGVELGMPVGNGENTI